LPAQTFDTPVLVVGAGPVGAVLALELARHNVPSMVVERSPAASAHPKMDYLTGRSMELLRRFGLAGSIRARGIGPQHTTDFSWTRGLDQPPVLVWHQPSVDQLRQRYAAVNDGSAPVEPYQRVQGSLFEELARDAVRDHPLVDLRERWTCVDLRLEPTGVVATVADAATGARHTVVAGYLAGCDGAGSTVRRCLEIPLDESGPRTQYCTVYFRSTDRTLRRYGPAFVTIGARGVTLVSRDEAHTWTGSVPISPDEPFSDPVTLIQERLGVPFAVDQVLSVAQWEGALAVATAYGKGSAYLVGDSAHQFYPLGGHGANTGIADAVDLGWKLAAAVHGWGGPDLLASYEAERRPVALFSRELCTGFLEVRQRFARLCAAGVSTEQIAGVLEREGHQVDNLGVHFGQRYVDSPVICYEPDGAPGWQWCRIVPTTWPGGRAPAVRLADGTELFDRFGTGFTLVDRSGGGTGAALVAEATARGIPMTHLPVTDPAVSACWERDLVLVRPDQHVAWRGDAPPADWDAVLDRVTGQGTTRTRHVHASLAGQTLA
jgi:2-polyprenyl-6-methoxyphenol hydroxylase-like FAD-dependent oxidoreductase